MTKLRKIQIDTALEDNQIWDDFMCEWYDDYYRKEEYEQVWLNDDDYDYEMSWQWYMETSIRKREGWHYVVTNNEHNITTVKNWLHENYPGCEFKHERNHFLIKDHGVATMVTLKWS